MFASGRQRLSDLQRSILVSLCCHVVLFGVLIDRHGGAFSLLASRPVRVQNQSLLVSINQIPSDDLQQSPAPVALTMPSVVVPENSESVATGRNTDVETEASAGARAEIAEKTSEDVEMSAEEGSAYGFYRGPKLLSTVGTYFSEPLSAGVIVLALDIDASGKATDVRTLSSDLPPYFTQVIEKRFLAASFKPAEQGGIAIADTVEFKVVVGTADASRLMGDS